LCGRQLLSLYAIFCCVISCPRTFYTVLGQLSHDGVCD
jgi:hypothetical protein